MRTDPAVLCPHRGCESIPHAGPCADTPTMVVAELADIIRRAELERPRTVQKIIGPSGIGTTCTRWLLHMLAQTPEPGADRIVNHWSWVGTAIHDRLERDVNAFGNRLAPEFLEDAAEVIAERFSAPRWVTETRVTIGTVGGQVISGNVDLIDTATRGVVDYKGCGKSSTAKMKAAIRKTGGVEVTAWLGDDTGFAIPGFQGGSPGGKYRAQLQAYGLGVLLTLGWAPAWVMNLFIPRNSTSVDAFRSGEVWFWSEPFDAQVAMAAIERANGLADLLGTVGLAAALDMFKDEQCAESHCPHCPRQRAASASTTADPFGLGEMKGTA